MRVAWVVFVAVGCSSSPTVPVHLRVDALELAIAAGLPAHEGGVRAPWIVRSVDLESLRGETLDTVGCRREAIASDNAPPEVAAHELGHLFGLGHVGDVPGNLMRDQVAFGDWELEDWQLEDAAREIERCTGCAW